MAPRPKIANPEKTYSQSRPGINFQMSCPRQRHKEQKSMRRIFLIVLLFKLGIN
jgi:hypothetical protein